ncbi:MAG TPA: hypothetical protein EYQ74_00055 [Planctomycetes bacterium]|nr:hypothetical protein [Planctomycetota bacterium]HIK59609.1 hypothetical protein [Planctomycetota bacterium]
MTSFNLGPAFHSTIASRMTCPLTRGSFLPALIALHLCASPVLALQGGALTKLLSTTGPGAGVYSSLSDDGSTLFHVAGSHLAEIDLAQVRAVMSNPGSAPADAWEMVTTDLHELDASPFAVRDLGSTLFVAGGDMGLFSIDRSISPPVTVKLDDGLGRWCFDIELSNDKAFLLAVWGGFDATELRVYSAATGVLVRTVAFDNSHLVRGGIGYALELHTDAQRTEFAYLAMGRSGIARVNWRNAAPQVEQCYDPAACCVVGASGCLGAQTLAYCIDTHRVRDVSIAGDKLYAAADGAGLIEVDLASAPLGGSVLHAPTVTYPDGTSIQGYPVRVSAVLHPGAVMGQDRIVVAMGVATEPSVAREWGPYYRYATFAPDLSQQFPSGGFSVPGGRSSLLDLQVFETGGPSSAIQLNQVLQGVAPNHSTPQGMKSLALQVVGGTYWLFNNEFIAWSFGRDTSGALSGLTSSAPGQFASPVLTYADVTVSLKDPQLLLCAADGPNEGSQHRISGAFDSIDVIPGTTQTGNAGEFSRFALGLSLDAQWAQPNSPFEWVVSAGWKLSRFRAMPFYPNPFLRSCVPFHLEFPADPLCPLLSGRNYTTMAVDEDDPSGWLLLSRSHVYCGLAFYWRADLHAEADSHRLLRFDDVTELLTPAVGVVNLHDEWSGCDYSLSSPIRDMQSTGLKVFQWTTGVPARKVAVVCAGKNVVDDSPRLVFTDLGDCPDPSGACGAFIDPATGKPKDKSKVEVFSVGPYHAMAFALDVAVIAGRQYAFVADTSGRLTAIELRGLFSTAGDPTIVDTWRINRSVLDRQFDILTDVVLRWEVPTGGGKATPCAYVAAERAGLYRFDIQVAPGSGDISFAPPTSFNTPGQAAKVTIRDVAPGPQEVMRLFVSDHNDSGIRMYGN